MNNMDTKLQGYEQKLLMLRGELTQVEQQVENVKAEAFRTEGRILELRELKQQEQAEKDKAAKENEAAEKDT